MAAQAERHPHGWVACGNYSKTAGAWLRERADTIVWLDLPRRTVFARVVRRTLGRVFGRKKLWNGNRERFSNLLSRDPEENIIRWTWVMHPRYRATYEAAQRESRWPHNRSLFGHWPFPNLLDCESVPP